MNICIIDDDKYVSESIEKMISISCNNLKISKPNICTFTTPNDFIKWFSSSTSIDVCFLDINLENKKIDGLKIAKLIKEANYHTLIVFMTGYDNYFSEMVQVEPFRFLSKPIKYDNFYMIFKDVYDRIILKKSEDHNPVYECKCNGITYRLNLNEVICFSSYKRKIYVHSRKTFNVNFYEKLDNVEEEIRTITNKYVRINKSYLFNKDFIERVGKNSISVEGVEYTISPKYKNNIKIIT